MARLFISQDRIDRWAAQEKVSLDGDRMHLPLFGTTFRLIPGFHFLRAVGDGADPHGLLGLVKTDAQLRDLGADMVASSVVLDEAAYDCEVGFVGEVIETGDPAALRQAHLSQLSTTDR